MATNVYVDGFNLYYGSLKDRPYRWLDLDALSRVLLPRDQINRIRYFTARVSDRPSGFSSRGPPDGSSTSSATPQPPTSA